MCFYTTMRKQINIRVDDDVQVVIDDIRSLSRPVPSVTQAIVQALYEKRDRLQKAQERKQ